MAAESAALEVRNLTITVPMRQGKRAPVVRNASFTVEPGGTVGLVGESGSGKTMTSLAIMGLLPPGARVERGEILLGGEDLLKKSAREMRRIRGRRLSMVLQDPMTALDPSFTIRHQLAEPLRHHRKLAGSGLDEAMVTAIERVQLSAAKERLSQYPHQLSGGMRQRVVSAVALAGEPNLLIADEPTSALDVTTQARYLRMLRELQQDKGFALLLIAHDLLVVRHLCEQVVVMYASEVVEQGPAEQVFASPQHPYTRALLGSIPVTGETEWLDSIEGQIPDLAEEIDGCRFGPRCGFVQEICQTRPALTPRGDDREARCWGTLEQGWIDG